MISISGGMGVGVFEGVAVKNGTAGGRPVATAVLPAHEVIIEIKNRPARILRMWRLYTFHLPTPSGCAKLN
jgi:uncharacterized membrane protein YbhN (UPF0104 family)